MAGIKFTPQLALDFYAQKGLQKSADLKIRNQKNVQFWKQSRAKLKNKEKESQNQRQVCLNQHHKQTKDRQLSSQEGIKPKPATKEKHCEVQCKPSKQMLQLKSTKLCKQNEKHSSLLTSKYQSQIQMMPHQRQKVNSRKHLKLTKDQNHHSPSKVKASGQQKLDDENKWKAVV